MRLEDNQSLKERIRQESKQYLNLPPGPDEFTRMEFQEANDIDVNKAFAVLDKMVKDGKVTVRDGNKDGSFCKVYKFRQGE